MAIDQPSKPEFNQLVLSQVLNGRLLTAALSSLWLQDRSEGTPAQHAAASLRRCEPAQLPVNGWTSFGRTPRGSRATAMGVTELSSLRSLSISQSPIV